MPRTRTQFSGLALVLSLPALLAFSSGEVQAEDRPPIGVMKGEMYPDFLLPTLDGEIKRLSDFRGKKILLFHFASW